MKEAEREKLIDYIDDFVYCYTPCIGCETPDKWIEIISEKHGQRQLDDDNIEMMQMKLGFTLTEKDKITFMKIWNETFKRVMIDYRAKLKKAKNEEEKEYIKKHGIKRKTQESVGKKKKSKRK